MVSFCTKFLKMNKKNLEKKKTKTKKKKQKKKNTAFGHVTEVTDISVMQQNSLI